MPTGKHAQLGFTYLYVLMLIAAIGMGLAAAGTLWSTESLRAREAELLLVGDQYRRAIRSYVELDPAHPRLPQTIEELLEDRRQQRVVRHLRRAYPDPLTGAPLALVRMSDTQGITGVYSSATGQPLKRAGFSSEDRAFSDATRYAEWRFEITPPPPPGKNAE
jgi:type II secretory pathway pseudopilin PulG